MEVVFQLADSESPSVDKLQGTSGLQGFLPNGSCHLMHLPQSLNEDITFRQGRSL